jgi:hypothetical protein
MSREEMIDEAVKRVRDNRHKLENRELMNFLNNGKPGDHPYGFKIAILFQDIRAAFRSIADAHGCGKTLQTER